MDAWFCCANAHSNVFKYASNAGSCHVASPFVRQASVQVQYKGTLVGDARIDLLVGERLIVELKAVENVAPIHLAQAMSYLKATKLHLALLIIFNAPVLLRGVRRVVLSTL